MITPPPKRWRETEWTMPAIPQRLLPLNQVYNPLLVWAKERGEVYEAAITWQREIFLTVIRETAIEASGFDVKVALRASSAKFR
ncbi:MAG: hypothetical protein M2R45_02906 [Verrucomicrobia subdivision 3 bacterium]|nr:hypothetical protein [Limisphaerales bacterium]MCS1415372.1 hypothetical protein [Limisphaerales bacterium]